MRTLFGSLTDPAFVSARPNAAAGALVGTVTYVWAGAVLHVRPLQTRMRLVQVLLHPQHHHVVASLHSGTVVLPCVWWVLWRILDELRTGCAVCNLAPLVITHELDADWVCPRRSCPRPTPSASSPRHICCSRPAACFSGRRAAPRKRVGSLLLYYLNLDFFQLDYFQLSNTSHTCMDA